MDKFKNIGNAPTRLRAQVKSTGANPTVDRENNIISGISVMTRGEALGHGAWVDADMIEAVATLGNDSGHKGIKARFAHPGLSADGLGTLLGRVKDFYISEDDSQVFGDLHILDAAFSSPDGDLATHVMDLAEQAPDLAGFSIVFSRDIGAEKDFEESNIANNSGTFISPDPENENDLPHFRIQKLFAVDMVDEPAANEGGMFSAGDIPHEAEQVLDYVIRDGDTPSGSFGIHPDRMKISFQGYLARHDLEIVPKDKGRSLESVTLQEREDQVMDDPKKDVATNEEVTETPLGQKDIDNAVKQERERCATIVKEGRELGISEFSDTLLSDGTPLNDALGSIARESIRVQKGQKDEALAGLQASLDANKVGANAQKNEPEKTGAKTSDSTHIEDADVQKLMKQRPELSYGEAMRELSKNAKKGAK